MGWWPSRAVTFIDNHDTGSTQAHWPFPSRHIMEGYTYILTHPGIPSVFYDHFYDWGNSTHDQIVKLIDIRKHRGINSRSSIRTLEAQPNLYAATIGEKVSMKIGDGSWCPAGKEWTLATSAIAMQYGRSNTAEHRAIPLLKNISRNIYVSNPCYYC